MVDGSSDWRWTMHERIHGALTPFWGKTATTALLTVWQLAKHQNFCVWDWERNNIGWSALTLIPGWNPQALISWCHFHQAPEWGLLKNKQTNKQTERLRLEGDLKAHLVPAHKQGCHPLDKLKRTVSSLGKTKAAQYMLSLHGGFSSVNRHGFLSYQLLKCISRWPLQTHCRQTQTFCF